MEGGTLRRKLKKLRGSILKKPLWTPSKNRVRNSNMSGLIRYVSRHTSTKIKSYEELYNWSVNEPEKFWKSIWDVSGIIHSKGYRKILSAEKKTALKKNNIWIAPIDPPTS